MEYYTLWYRLSYQNHYTIWCSDSDGKDFLLTENGVIPYFSTKSDLDNYAEFKKLNIENELPILHKLDIVKIWLHNTNSIISCSDFIATWNLFSDISSSVTVPKKQFDLINQSHNEVYVKLF